MILENQKMLKTDFKRKLQELAVSQQEKQDLTRKNQEKMMRQFKTFIDKQNKKIIREVEKNNLLKREYLSLYTNAKKIDHENKKLKFIFAKNNDFLKQQFKEKILNLDKNVKREQKLIQNKHKSLLREHEEFKLELNKRLIAEKSRRTGLEKKYSDLILSSKDLIEDNRKLHEVNKKLIHMFSMLKEKSLAKENLLEHRTKLIKKDFESKLSKLTKSQLDKEIEYKTKIDSLREDLSKYYTRLKKTKKEYYKREKELKEKFKEIFSY
jgi:hypothetical protein